MSAPEPLPGDVEAAAVLASLPLAVAGFDPVGRVIHWSPAAEALFGWSAEEVLGRAPGDEALGRAEPGAAALQAFLARACRRLPQGTAADTPLPLPEGDGVLPARDGREVEVVAWTAPLCSADGRERGTVAVFADVTVRRRAERERAAMEDHLHRLQKIEAIGRLSGGVAHDFNNLLMAIKGNAEMAALDIPEGSSALEDLAEIRSAAARAADLTRQLLAFSRKQVFRPQRMDLGARIRSMADKLRGAAATEIRLDLHPAAGAVDMDPTQLEQVMLNLLENAGDAVAAGGEISVATRPVDLGPDFSRELLYDIPPGPYVSLLVKDTGVGMEEAVREHVFEPFYTTKEKGKGTGLGLATVYGIVKQSGGFIEVTSSPGAGTEVSILLPRVADGGEESCAAPSPVRSLRGTETVLLVEDERSVLALTRRVLARSGYRVLEAGSGSEALRIAHGYAGPIHLLVTDVVMPGILGPELALRLREDRPEARVLFMSGYNEDVVSRGGVLKPGTAFIGKPFSPSAFLHRVREILDDDEPARAGG